MEKQSPSKNLGLFFLVILTIFSLGAGTLGVSGFIRANVSISFFAETGFSMLVAVAFIGGYFVNSFVMPLQPFTTKASCLPAILYLVWGMLLLTIVILVLLNIGRPIYLLWSAMLNYSMAGWMLANTSNRLRAALKK